MTNASCYNAKIKHNQRRAAVSDLCWLSIFILLQLCFCVNALSMQPLIDIGITITTTTTSKTTSIASDTANVAISRRHVFSQLQSASTVLLLLPLISLPTPANAINNDNASSDIAAAINNFSSGQAEYTNSIVASRDTNISPQEVYDTILNKIPHAEALCNNNNNGNNNNNINNNSTCRALDLGAGAGVSTMYLYNKLGYKHVDAVDWSRNAWDDFVKPQLMPNTIKFYQATDDEYFAELLSLPKQSDSNNNGIKYNVIVYNFAINPNKARKVATTYLSKPNGLLLAPVNDQADYWYKQKYWLLNAQGELLYQSASEVGAWSVQFQPDVTSSTCTGFWCGNMNGYLKK